MAYHGSAHLIVPGTPHRKSAEPPLVTYGLWPASSKVAQKPTL